MATDPPVRCPACGSALTSPREDPEMWECRYYSAIFPVEIASAFRMSSFIGYMFMVRFLEIPVIKL